VFLNKEADRTLSLSPLCMLTDSAISFWHIHHEV